MANVPHDDACQKISRQKAREKKPKILSFVLFAWQNFCCPQTQQSTNKIKTKNEERKKKKLYLHKIFIRVWGSYIAYG